MSTSEKPFDTGVGPEGLDPERPEPFETPWGSFFLVRTGGELVAVESWCPHLMAPLFQGSFSGDEVTCPWHAWRFDLTTGSCTWAPDYETVKDTRLTRLKVSLEAGSYRIHPPGPREA